MSKKGVWDNASQGKFWNLGPLHDSDAISER